MSHNTEAAPSSGKKIVNVIVMTALLTAGSIGVATLFYTAPGKIPLGGDRTPAAAFNATQVPWVAAAPGRVEPRSGQIKISAAIAGRITELPVRVNDRVVEGEVLIRLDDVEARARLAAAEAEASARRRERDSQPTTAGREDVRRAEDALFTAERGITNARFELDDIIASERKGRNAHLRAEAMRRLSDAQERLRQAQLSYATAQSKGPAPAPSRLEAAVSAARSDVAVAESLVDKARIRAPMAGTVLQLNVKMGETVGPGIEAPLVVTGDLSVIRVRAEVDERDVSKIKLGQKAFVRSSGYPGQEFEGKITELAPSLASPRFGSRGPRRATDVEVMEVMIDLEGAVPLLPGMRAEAFFRREGFYRQ